MSDVKWIKIKTDIFDDEKILLIESMPSADSIIVIWFKLLAFAGKQNNDGVFIMSNRIAYTDEMLASIFRRDLNTVRMALGVFENLGMIEIIDNVITIPNWNKHQSLDSYEKKKERDRLYQQERRSKQKAIVEKSSDKSSDIAISEKERERDKEYSLNREYISTSSCEDIETVISYLNQRTGSAYKTSTRKTRDLIRARMNEGFTVDDFKTVIDNKTEEWGKPPKAGQQDMSKYLRPETLFGTKFESYLNEGRVKRHGTGASEHEWVCGHHI